MNDYIEVSKIKSETSLVRSLSTGKLFIQQSIPNQQECIKILNKLNKVTNSPYFVPFLEIIHQNANTIIISECIKETLDITIAHQQLKREYLPESEIWRMTESILQALKQLHACGIIHKNLKSSSIVANTYQLCDIAIQAKHHYNFYTSPELFRSQPFSFKSDVWALGCIIYEMAALKLPYQSNNPQELYNKIHKGIFRRIPAKYSDNLQQFITMCLQTHPNARPTIQELIEFTNKLRQQEQSTQNSSYRLSRKSLELPRLRQLSIRTHHTNSDYNLDIARRQSLYNVTSKLDVSKLFELERCRMTRKAKNSFTLPYNNS